MSSGSDPWPRRRPTPVRRSDSDRIVEISAGGVVVRLVEERPHLLLIRDPYRKWGLPKGHLEEGEGPEEAALREVHEETGLDDLRLGPDLGEIDWTFRNRGRLIHKFCRFYLMSSARSVARPEVAEGISDCRWLPVQQALRTIAYDNARAVLRRGAERIRETWEEGEPFWEEEQG